MWEACWAHYQTDYFHLFLCMAIIAVYGEDVVDQDLPADEMLLHFSSLSMHMNGEVVLRKVCAALIIVKEHSTVDYQAYDSYSNEYSGTSLNNYPSNVDDPILQTAPVNDYGDTVVEAARVQYVANPQVMVSDPAQV